MAFTITAVTVVCCAFAFAFAFFHKTSGIRTDRGGVIAMLPTIRLLQSNGVMKWHYLILTTYELYAQLMNKVLTLYLQHQTIFINFKPASYKVHAQ